MPSDDAVLGADLRHASKSEEIATPEIKAEAEKAPSMSTGRKIGATEREVDADYDSNSAPIEDCGNENSGVRVQIDAIEMGVPEVGNLHELEENEEGVAGHPRTLTHIKADDS